MPSYLAGARIRKPDHITNSRCHSSSPFNTAPRIKPNQRTKSLTDALEAELDDGDDRLDATGKILSIIEVPSATDVLSAIQYSNADMFDPIPERAGMNSVRIAEVLNFRKNLPPVVSLSHVHALISASSRTERQISALLDEGRVRKIKVVGRGNDISGTSDFLIPMPLLESALQSSTITEDVTASFIHVLQQNPRVTSLKSNQLPVAHITALTRAGFLVSIPASATRNLSFSGSSFVATAKISRAHSGSSAAVGGDSAFEELGGTGNARRHGTKEEDRQGQEHGELALSMPNMGPYIRLLNAGRNHLIALLGKAKYREAPMYLLRERWDGAVDNQGSVSQAKRLRGEFSEVMPAKTKKWKNLLGMRFEWAMEECLGAGIVELFETRSVGLGVRGI